jgi:hypothetical protein
LTEEQLKLIKRYSKKFLQLVKLYHEQYPLTENI